MKKSLIVSGIVVLLIAIGAGVWDWQRNAKVSISNRAVPKPTIERLTEGQPADFQKKEVALKILPTGEQVVRNNTQGYEITVPKGWFVQKPEGGDTGFRVLPPESAACIQMGFGKTENPEKKSPAQSFKDDASNNDLEEGQYTIEPYNSQFNESVIITTKNMPDWHTKNLYFSKGDSFYAFGVVSRGPINKDCERIFFDAIKTISLF
ncbi:MAG: hypothetical protein HY001_01685 [Candidatus Portnoybacteria bacterium]|nr:hypothetical protein [Candidatus Portnoybacteria bacterium]